MTFIESILIALFCIAVVFSVLGILWGIIRVFSTIINIIEQKQEKTL
jgi:Na+-transporting methylmalonyl-CoA/oxaloacetate decarboxylase gamma subunit